MLYEAASEAISLSSLAQLSRRELPLPCGNREEHDEGPEPLHLMITSRCATRGSYDAVAVVGFLRVLLRKIKGPILLIWDGSPIHRAHQIKEFLKQGAAKRLHLEQLPGYAPDLNPDEGIWNYLKRVELGNVCCSDLGQLSTELIRARERLRHKRDIIRACSRQCGYGL